MSFSTFVTVNLYLLVLDKNTTVSESIFIENLDGAKVNLVFIGLLDNLCC